MKHFEFARDLAWSRGGTNYVTTGGTCLSFSFLAIYLNIFPLNIWPRTFTIEFHAKKCIRSGIMVLESHVDHLIFCHALRDEISWTLNPPTLAQLLQVSFSSPLLAAGLSVFCLHCQKLLFQHATDRQGADRAWHVGERLNIQRQKKPEAIRGVEFRTWSGRVQSSADFVMQSMASLSEKKVFLTNERN